MNSARLTKSERVRLIRQLRDSFDNEPSWNDVDLLLTGFGLSNLELHSVTDSHEALSRAQWILTNASDEDLLALAAHQFGDDSTKREAELEASVAHLWLLDHVRVFVSHLSSHERFAAEVVEELQKLRIDGFVAHKDIEPDLEWQNEIESALATCHVLVGLLHEGFSQSAWTQQEVGWALGRGVPVLMVALEEIPTGFK